jgi:putative ABC transport system substrate-binding protein
MDRRTFSAIAGVAFAVPHALFAQPVKRLFRITILDDAGDGARKADWDTFRNRMRELGIVDGKTAIYEARYAGGVIDRLPALAAELVATKPDIVVTAGTPATRAGLRATNSIPVVFVAAGDPVGAGLVASLARPGGNVTGISTVANDVEQKAFEVLAELLPAARRMGYLSDPGNQNASSIYSRIEEQARRRKVAMLMLDGVGRAALDRAFATIKRENIQGVLVGTVGTLLDHRDEIAQYGLREKLPVVSARPEYVVAGCLLSFGVDRVAIMRRGAEYVHRILQGARPANLPVEQASKFRLIINQKTARALGVRIPDSIRIRADEVIE